MRQIEALARLFHRPLSLFFGDAVPQVPPLAAEYRRLPGVTIGQESPELRLAIRQMSSRRETMIELLKELGEEPPAFALFAHLSEAPSAIADRLRAALKIELSVQLGWPNDWRAWAEWRGAAESIGVLAFQFPRVTLEEARGLSLLRFPLPVAGVNSKEQPESRSFTLLHEVVHIMLAAGSEEVPALRETRVGDAWSAVERFAEEVASRVLVPEDALQTHAERSAGAHGEWSIGEVRGLARKFHISPLAMATRLRASGYLDWEGYNDWKAAWTAYVRTLPPRKGGPVHPIAQALGRAGRPYTQVVLDALASNRITAVNASRYLGLKFEHFEKLRESLSARPGSGGDDE